MSSNVCIILSFIHSLIIITYVFILILVICISLNYCSPWKEKKKKNVWIITNTNFKDTSPLFKSLNILNLADLPRLNVASYIFKSVDSNNCSTQPLHYYQTYNKLSLHIPRHKLSPVNYVEILSLCLLKTLCSLITTIFQGHRDISTPRSVKG